MVIQSLFPIPSRDTYINPLPIIIMFHGGMHAWYTTFFEFHHPPKAHSPSLLQLLDTSSDPPLFLFNLSRNILWLFKIICILFVQELLTFMVFLLKKFLNGLSLLKCLSRRLRNYLPLLMLVSLQNCGLNQITLLFLFFSRLFE